MLVLSLAIIALPIALMHPAFIDQDTYQYASIANYYIHTPHWHVREVYTVGPVIPLLMAGLKTVLCWFFTWSPNVDVSVIKLTSFGCFLAIVLSARSYYRAAGFSTAAVALFTGIVLFSMPSLSATLSPNGELVCSAFLAVLIAISARPTLSAFGVAAAVVLATLILYTKLQAVLILALCLVSCFRGATRKRILIGFFAAIIAVETILHFIGGGWAPKIAALVRYVQVGHETGGGAVQPDFSLYGSIAHYFSRSYWVLTHALSIFPVALTAVLLAFRLRPHDRENRWFFPAWLVTTFASIFIPGRTFDHYLMFVLPFLVLFSGEALRRLHTPSISSPWIIAALVAMSAIKFVSLAPTREYFGGNRIFGVIPPQFISAEAEKMRPLIPTSGSETLFVHGWDYRFYTLFNKGQSGPGIWPVRDGTESPEQYLRELLDTNPTYIVDVINHSGVVRDQILSIASIPLWQQTIEARYAKIFEENGLVLYKRRVTKPAVEVNIPPGIRL